MLNRWLNLMFLFSFIETKNFILKFWSPRFSILLLSVLLWSSLRTKCMPRPQIIESEKFLRSDLESALSQIVKPRKGNNPFCCTRLIIKTGLKREWERRKRDLEEGKGLRSQNWKNSTALADHWGRGELRLNILLNSDFNYQFCWTVRWQHYQNASL